jgi:hypothetical protein
MVAGTVPDPAPAPVGGRSRRDPYVDILRAFSLTVVVVWHWAFTIITWTPTGPLATSPLEFTYDLWPITWLGQVMPLFFFVGGWAHRNAWGRVREAGGGYGTFVVGRARRLLIPTGTLLALWGVVYVIVRLAADPEWLSRAVLLVISPLWFLAVYLVLVAVAPIMLGLHRRAPVTTIVVLGVGILALDAMRFANGVDWTGPLQFVVVWTFCHQLGFFYGTFVGLGRDVATAMLIGGLLALIALIETGVYPRSMVGVPGDNISNMGPPTACMAALLVFQVGGALLMRDTVLGWLRNTRFAIFTDLMNRIAMPLFLFHTTALALFLGVLYALGWTPPPEPDGQWWLVRPLFLIGPLICMIPVLWVFSRRTLDEAFESLDAFRKDVPLSESRF